MVFGCKTTSLWVPALTCGFVHLKQRLLDGKNKSLWVPDITCRFVYAKQRDLHQNDKSIWVLALICVFFFIQNSDFRTRLTSLYWSQPSSAVFACKTATFGPASKSPFVSNLTCQFVRTKQRAFHQNYRVSMGPRPLLWICVFKTATLAPHLQVSMGARPHLWFCAFKKRLYDQN